jgi:hypothetical protein
MDRELVNLFRKYDNQKGDFIFRAGIDTFFIEKEDGVYLKYVPANNELFEYKLKEICELYEGDGIFNFDSDEDTNHYFVLLESIESAIDTYYQNNYNLKDKNVKFILERLVKNPGIKLNSELLKSIQNNIKACLSFNIYSEHEVKGAIKRILRSIKDHHRLDGSTGYLDFLENRLQI